MNKLNDLYKLISNNSKLKLSLHKAKNNKFYNYSVEYSHLIGYKQEFKYANNGVSYKIDSYDIDALVDYNSKVKTSLRDKKDIFKNLQVFELFGFLQDIFTSIPFRPYDIKLELSFNEDTKGLIYINIKLFDEDIRYVFRHLNYKKFNFNNYMIKISKDIEDIIDLGNILYNKLEIKCKKCKVVLPKNEFYINNSNSTGHESICIKCTRERVANQYNEEKKRKYYIQNRDRILKRAKAYSPTVRKEVKNKRAKTYRSSVSLEVLESHNLYYSQSDIEYIVDWSGRISNKDLAYDLGRTVGALVKKKTELRKRGILND